MGVAVASAGPHANHLHLAPDHRNINHIIRSLLQTDNHAGTSSLNFFTGRMHFLADVRSTLSKHWRQCIEHWESETQQRGNLAVATSSATSSPVLSALPIKSFCMFLSPHAMHAKTCRLLFLWVTPFMKSTKFGSRYLAEGLTKRDEIWQIDRGSLATHNHPDWWTLIQGVPMRRQNSEGCTKIVTLLSYTVWPSVMKSGAIRGIGA